MYSYNHSMRYLAIEIFVFRKMKIYFDYQLVYLKCSYNQHMGYFFKKIYFDVFILEFYFEM